KILNKAVKRNIDRFPKDFMFQLEPKEYELLRTQSETSEGRSNLRFQFGTSSWGGRRTYPFVFTEQGVAMLSAVLKSEIAVKVSIQIMQAFVVMRRFIITNAQIFQRLNTLEMKQVHTDKKVNEVLSALEDKSIQPKQGIFFNGQVFDAWSFVSNLIRSARKSIVIIDNYIDDRVLSLFSKREKDVSVVIYTKIISRQLTADLQKFNEQYPPVTIKEFGDSHDRFLVIDDVDFYHIGASFKDLGKKWFAFSKMDVKAVEILEKLKNNNAKISSEIYPTPKNQLRKIRTDA
ncbi:MAG: ORF6N domain-containing protein, partial [Fibrobacteres bacterium]|nr:ORF6N domain-containing protein [Fibrobacterota bacterium]